MPITIANGSTSAIADTIVTGTSAARLRLASTSSLSSNAETREIIYDLRFGDLRIACSASFGALPFLFLLGARSHAKACAGGGDRRGHVPAFRSAFERRDEDGDLVVVLDHAVAVTSSVHVVGAVTLELDLSGSLLVGHLEHQPHVRIDSFEFLDHPGDRDALAEIKLDGGMMRRYHGGPEGDECRCRAGSRDVLHDSTPSLAGS